MTDNQAYDTKLDSSDVIVTNPEEINNEEEFKVYKIRWGVLFSVAFLNISNAAIWLNNFPSATDVANYYELESTESLNWFSMTYLIVAIPFSFIGPYCANRFGLRTVIWTGCLLNCLGATIRVIATSGVIDDKHSQFAVGLFGQSVSAIAQNFVLYLHTKVSQTWFPERQRGLATSILSISDPLGIVFVEIIVPFVMTSEDRVPLNDKVWFGVALLTVISTGLFVRRSKPKTPPSRSATNIAEKPPYLQQLKKVFTCKPFLLLLLSLGGGVAFTITFQTITQEVLCPLGYSDGFGGLINALMILVGFVGSFIVGVLLDRTKKFTEITLYLFGAAAICGIILVEFMLNPNNQVSIAIFATLFGFFGVSIFPAGLELAVETTYPIEETITTAMVFLSGQLQSIVYISLVPVLAVERPDSSQSTCGFNGGEPTKDYTYSLILVMFILAFNCIITIMFFKTDYKRQNAEREQKENEKMKTIKDLEYTNNIEGE